MIGKVVGHIGGSHGSVLRKKHELEQLAYEEVRRVLTNDFLEHPQEFVAHFKCRPEDLSGAVLRDYYRTLVAEKHEPDTNDQTFKRRFMAGSLFGIAA